MANQDLTVWLDQREIQNQILKSLGKNSPAFREALINIYNNNKLLQTCEPKSILSAALLATTMHLSISPSFGHAYIVPYKDKAQLQLGYKGYIQLAMRTGRYKKIRAGKVYAGQIRGFDLRGNPIEGSRTSDKVIGYIAYMLLVDGFEHFEFMSVADIQAHAERYSQSYAYDKRSGKASSIWSTNFDAMARKTVLKRLLNSGFAPLSTELHTAIQADQSVVDGDSFDYVDNPDRKSGDRSTIYSFDSAPAPAVNDVVIDATAETIPSSDAPNVEFAGNCSNCGKPVMQKVFDYSKNKFGKVLCFDCQKKE